MQRQLRRPAQTTLDPQRSPPRTQNHHRSGIHCNSCLRFWTADGPVLPIAHTEARIPRIHCTPLPRLRNVDARGFPSRPGDQCRPVSTAIRECEVRERILPSSCPSPVWVRPANPHAVTGGGEQGAGLALAAVNLQQSHEHPGLLTCPNLDQSDDACVGPTQNHRKLAKILVERYQDLAVGERMREYFIVSGISGPVAYPVAVVTKILDLTPCTAPDTGVQ